MTETGQARVAVLGARGIGRHHAHWWTREGARVSAILGTSAETLAAAEEGLRSLFAYDGAGYTDLDALLEAERPDFVDVCSPPALHFEHVAAALDAGCHVLCEKPFVYRPGAARTELVAQANELAERAARNRRRLGLCTQYVMGAPQFMRLWREKSADAPVTRFTGHLASPAKGRAPDPARVWVDLAPHLLSVIQTLEPEAEIAWDTLQTGFDGYVAEARFAVTRPCGTPLRCELRTNNTHEPPANIRRVALNDYPFNVEGDKDDEGVYCARIETPDGVHTCPDLMRLLIRDFLAGRTPADGAFAVRNVDWLLRILEASGASTA